MHLRFALAIVAAVAMQARADTDAIVHGTVVKVEDHEIYVDLGTSRGIADGAPLRLKRPIHLKHPITRAPISDWIPIGAATITQAGSTLSRAVIGELVDQVQPGDIAEVLVVAEHDASPQPVVASGPPVDPATQDVLRVFAGQANQPIDTRIATWERYLSRHPGSKLAPAITTDLETLRNLRDAMHAPTAAQINESVSTVAHHAPSQASLAAAVPVAFVLAQPEHVASAYLHYRTAGTRTYRRLLLVREHDVYLRGVIPADAVRPPGVEYFVELATPSGRTSIALGSPESPTRVEVAAPPILERFAATPDRSSVHVDARYLDFATFDKRTGNRRDTMTQATIDFVYRLDGRRPGPSFVESLGVGYGIYDGKGGFADHAWTASDPLPTAGFRYGYADIEVGGHLASVHVSAGGQVIAGVGRDGFGMGLEGRVRLGDRDDTNLVLSGRTVDQVGYLSEIKLGVRPLDAVMVGVSVGATDQPARGDTGVILGTELELVSLDRVSITARGSWQGRSTQHGGVGGGAGVGFYW